MFWSNDQNRGATRTITIEKVIAQHSSMKAHLNESSKQDPLMASDNGSGKCKVSAVKCIDSAIPAVLNVVSSANCGDIASSNASTTRQHLKSNGIYSGISGLTGDQKTSLAMNISIARAPGAYNCVDDNSRRGAGSSSSAPARAKPSQDQLMGMGRLCSIQKDRALYQQPNMGLQEYQPDSEDPIDDLQARMRGSYEDDGPLENEGKEELGRKKRRISTVVTFVVLVLSSVIAIFLGIRGGSTTVSDDDDVVSSSCAISGDSIEAQTERYIQFRSMIDTKFPNMMSAINTPKSEERLALCWISDIDSLHLGIQQEEDIIQRFLLAIIYFRLDQRKPGAINAGDTKAADWNWLTEAHECDWDYIGCTDSREVLSLEMNNINLIGRIPSELALLTSLVSIEMAFNAFTGEIPSELWGMAQLERLMLRSNRLSGAVIQGVANLPALSFFSISDNKFAGTLPADRLDLPNLGYFDIGNNVFEGSFLDLSRSPKLVYLNFSRLMFTGSIPDYVWTLPNLAHLYSASNRLTGSIPTEIGLSTNLEALNIGENNLTGSIPSEIGRLSKLLSLELVDNRLTGTIPTEMCLLTGLTDLTLVSADAAIDNKEVIFSFNSCV